LLHNSCHAGYLNPFIVLGSLFKKSVPQGFYQNTDGTHSYSISDPEFADREPNMMTLFGGTNNSEYTDDELIKLFHSVPEIFAPIHEIASRVSDAVFLLKRTGNDAIIYEDADFNRLFSQPNPIFSFKKFIYQAVCYEIVTGKQYFYFNIPDTLAFDYKNIASWWNLPANLVKPELRKPLKLWSATTMTDIVTQYVIDQSGNKIEIKTEKVLPIHSVNLNWGKKHCEGESQLRAATKAIDNLLAVYAARFNVYDKRGSLGGFTSNKGDDSGRIALTPKERQAVINDLNQRYGITKGRSPWFVADQPLSFLQTNMSIKDLEPFSETVADAAAIYATLRVPSHLIPSKDKSTFNNANTDMKSFYSDVIIPRAKMYAEAFTTYFQLTAQRRYIDVDFSHIDILQENKKEKASVDKVVGDTFLQRFTNGVSTLNEWIIATGGEKVTTLPLYEKRIYEMDETELALVKSVMSMKGPVITKPETEIEKEDVEVPA
jgi:hypothetical protein